MEDAYLPSSDKASVISRISSWVTVPAGLDLNKLDSYMVYRLLKSMTHKVLLFEIVENKGI